MSKVLHEPPQDFIDKHLEFCTRTKKKHYGVQSIKRRCARELYSECIELGIKPVIRYEEYFEQYERLSQKGNNNV